MNEESPRNENGIAGKPLYPTAEANGHVFDSLQASNTEAPIHPKPDLQESIDRLHKEDPIPRLRTFQSDVAEAIQQKQPSKVSIAINEQKKEDSVSRIISTPPPSRRNLYLLLGSIVLIIGSAIAVTLFYYKSHQIIGDIVTPPPQKTMLISTEVSTSIAVPPQGPIIISEATLGIEPKDDALLGVTFTRADDKTHKPLDIQTFITLLSRNIPDVLVRSLKPNYAVGLQFIESGQPFIILKTNSYDSAFSGMLAWEATLFSDLQNPFAISSTTVPIPTFTDKIIKNKDVRELTDNSFSPIVLYSFIDKETIVITTNEETFKELVSRLTTSKFSQ